MANWIWYPGDFEIYHGMCQNFEREERGFFWPAYWDVADCRHHVMFHGDYELSDETSFRVHAHGIGYVLVKWKAEAPPWFPKDRDFFKEKKYVIGQQINCPKEHVFIEIVLANKTGLPSVYVEGEVISSDSKWKVSDFVEPPKPAGYNNMFVRAEQNPMEFEYTVKPCRPVSVQQINGGTLYDFGEELTADTVIEFGPGGSKEITLCYGESKAEALDTELCYLKQVISPELTPKESPFGIWETESRYHTKLRAFRYIFVPGSENPAEVKITAEYKYVDFPQRSRFTCSDSEVNEIWNVADRTFRLASGIFFLDGIKRDRWIWSGDAYQSYFINRYLFADREVDKRTIIALRGNDPITGHINTIVDYSLYWIISLENYYYSYKDKEFLEMMYPKLESMMDYCMAQTDEKGFLYGRPGDWIFIDWANMDKSGVISAEQMLLARSYQAMIRVRGWLGMDASAFEKKLEGLLANIKSYFWDEEKGAYIDCFESGKRNVTRHANIFALLFGYADKAQAQSILKNVLKNDQIEAITTPYFKFYELEALAQLGEFSTVMKSMKSYWGGMLQKGATTFWEEYKPGEPEEQQYGMYGDKYGKSLCHAWGASPIYLLGRYFMGIRPTSEAYESFEVRPAVEQFGSLSCKFPLGEGYVNMDCDGSRLTVLTDRQGGMLYIGDDSYTLEKGKELSITLKG